MDDSKFTDAQKKWSKLVAKCWSDPNFKQKFKTNPKEILREYGVEMSSPDAEYKIVENTKKTVYLVLPEHNETISSENLKRIAAAGCCNCSMIL